MIHIVYLTINIKNRKIYVGVHSTKDDLVFDNYLGCGVFANKANNFPNTPFEKAVKKYGPKSFERITLFRCNTKQEALDIEKIIVNEEFLKRKDVYNIALGGGMPPLLNKEIYQYSLDGKFIAEYKSIEEASKQIGAAFPGCISAAANYKTVSFGYLWAFEKINLLDLSEYKNALQKIEVHVYNKFGEYLESFDSLTEAAKTLEISKYTTISDAIKSGRQYKELYFSTIKTNILTIKKEFNNFCEIHQYDLEGNYIKTFKNRKDLKTKLLESTTGLADAIYKSIPFIGFRWSLDKVDKLDNITILKTTSLGKKIGQYTMDGNLIKEYDTVRECRKDFGNVSKVLRGTVSHCKGFTFRYID